MSQEVRDKLAGLEGWTTYTASNGVVVWERGTIDDGTYETRTDHPIPDDLNTCAAMWDRYAGAKEAGEWRWFRMFGRAGEMRLVGWAAVGPGVEVVHPSSGIDAAAELRDRWALLGKVLKARGV